MNNQVNEVLHKEIDIIQQCYIFIYGKYIRYEK